MAPAAAAATAAAVGAAVFTAAQPTPAYAVEQASDGDVVVEIHELTDAQGLQDAMRAKGLDATVAYRSGTKFTGIKLVLKKPEGWPDPPSNLYTFPTIVLGTDGLTDDQRTKCDIDPGAVPATVQQDDDGYRITIPADSPLQDRFFAITKVDDDAMTVSYASADGQYACLVQ